MKRIANKFACAAQGVLSAFRTEKSMKFHFMAALGVLIAASCFKLVLWKWVALFFTICLVLVTEMINTAIETAIDLINPTDHPLAKRAKDIGAGAVLLVAIQAVITGLLIFFF
jgi:diacylglycerol kinase